MSSTIASFHSAPKGRSYFTEFTLSKAILYGVSLSYVIFVALAAIKEPFTALPCDDEQNNLNSTQREFAQPYYDGNPCRQQRYLPLFFLTRDECSYGRRLLMAIVLGGLIGWERRSADRPAGIRTMALVSLGSSLFTICSAFAFNTSPQTWDASRISAAIPSGVGFLGAGLIFKENTSSEAGGPSHVVHGLTTAASLWLSAAVGIACGGELYFAASFGTAIMLLLLRFGPRNSDLADDEEEEDENDIDAQYQSIRSTGSTLEETTNLLSPLAKQRNMSVRRMSVRSKAQLATMV